MNDNLSINCRVCNSDNYQYLFYAKNSEIKNNATFKYYKCIECETIFLGKMPENLNKYYSKEYHPFKKDTNLDFKDKSNIDFIKKLKPNLSILELGVGNGKFLEHLKNIGHDCYCIEPYSEITAELKKNNINVIFDSLENLIINNLNFKVDIIYSWHSVEHLGNFSVFLKLCKKILNKNGYVIIGTPNQNSLSFKYYKQNWYHLQPPLHSFLVTSNEIEKQFNSIGFKKLKFSSKDIISIISSKFGWETSGFLLKKNSGKKIDSYIGKFLSFFMPYIEALLNRSSQYTIVFRNEK